MKEGSHTLSFELGEFSLKVKRPSADQIQEFLNQSDLSFNNEAVTLKEQIGNNSEHIELLNQFIAAREEIIQDLRNNITQNELDFLLFLKANETEILQAFNPNASISASKLYYQAEGIESSSNELNNLSNIATAEFAKWSQISFIGGVGTYLISDLLTKNPSKLYRIGLASPFFAVAIISGGIYIFRKFLETKAAIDNVISKQLITRIAPDTQDSNAEIPRITNVVNDVPVAMTMTIIRRTLKETDIDISPNISSFIFGYQNFRDLFGLAFNELGITMPSYIDSSSEFEINSDLFNLDVTSSDVTARKNDNGEFIFSSPNSTSDIPFTLRVSTTQDGYALTKLFQSVLLKPKMDCEGKPFKNVSSHYWSNECCLDKGKPFLKFDDILKKHVITCEVPTAVPRDPFVNFTRTGKGSGSIQYVGCNPPTPTYGNLHLNFNINVSSENGRYFHMICKNSHLETEGWGNGGFTLGDLTLYAGKFHGTGIFIPQAHCYDYKAVLWYQDGSTYNVEWEQDITIPYPFTCE